MLNIKSIVCSQCGSPDVTVKSEELAICNSCGSKIAIRPDVYNMTQPENKEDGKVMGISIFPMMDTESFVKKYSPVFVRKVWLKIASEDVPLDVFDCSLEEMQLEMYEMLVQSISSDVSFSASIGYRTAAGWSPVSGVKNYEYVQGAPNNPDQPYASEYYHSMMEAVKLIEKDEAKGILVDVNDSARRIISEAVKNASESACSMDLPGDRKRDVTCSVIKQEIKQEFVIIGLLLKTAINYKNERYSLSAIATDSMEVATRGSLPGLGNPDEIFKKEKEVIKDEYQSARREFDEKRRRLRKKLIWSCAIIAAIGVLLCFMFSKAQNGDLAFGSLYATWLISTPVSAILYHLKNKKAENAIESEREDNLKNAEQKYNRSHSNYMADKLKALNNVLSKYGLNKAEMYEISKKYNGTGS